MITYDDWPLIKECVDSVIGKVDKIIMVDGKFGDFPGDNNYSRNESVEYLLKLREDSKFKIILAGGLMEVEKRNVYLGCLNEGDICLNIDTDEVLIGDIPELVADIGIVMIGEWGDTKRHRRTCRFFKYQGGLHYWGRHSLILDKDNRVFASLDRAGKAYSVQKITEFEFLHNNHKRSYDRVKDKKKYYEMLRQREATINEPVT